MGAYGCHRLSLGCYGKAGVVKKTKVKTELGKSDRPGSSGDYRKRDRLRVVRAPVLLSLSLNLLKLAVQAKVFLQMKIFATTVSEFRD